VDPRVKSFSDEVLVVCKNPKACIEDGGRRCYGSEILLEVLQVILLQVRHPI
jgi:hypothetical protein